MIGLLYGEKNYDNILSRFHLIPERYGQTDERTDGRTDGQTDRFAISISCVSTLTRDKNRHSDTRTGQLCNCHKLIISKILPLHKIRHIFIPVQSCYAR